MSNQQTESLTVYLIRYALRSAVGVATLILPGMTWAQMPDFQPAHHPQRLLVRFLPFEGGSCTLCI